MICSYLRKHPVAEDTLEGIAEWWLEAEKIESSVDEVADALESLVQKGIVSIRKTQSGINLYRLAVLDRPVLGKKKQPRENLC